jgi:hypothetical protein
MPAGRDSPVGPESQRTTRYASECDTDLGLNECTIPLLWESDPRVIIYLPRCGRRSAPVRACRSRTYDAPAGAGLVKSPTVVSETERARLNALAEQTRRRS